MNNEPFSRNNWPTPAMRLYRTVVSIPFIRFVFSQEPARRDVLIKSVCRELYHEGGGRIYTRHPSIADILIKQDYSQFQTIVRKRFDNFRYDLRQEEDLFDYNLIESQFSEGEKVMVSSRSNIMYDGIFQFDSVINSEYCYIQFDSRSHIVRWKKNMIQKIDVNDSSNRRVTRQMARRRLLEASNSSHNQTEVAQTTTNFGGIVMAGRISGRLRNGRIVVTSELSEDSSDTESDVDTQNQERPGNEPAVARGLFDSSSDDDSSNNDSLNHDGRGVARARTIDLVDSSSSSENVIEMNNNETNEVTIQTRIENMPEGASYEFLLATLGDGTENRTTVDIAWLLPQGFISNPLKGEICYVCQEDIAENELVYDIKCNGIFRHPLHTDCARQYIEKKHTCCGICKFIWEP